MTFAQTIGVLGLLVGAGSLVFAFLAWRSSVRSESRRPKLELHVNDDHNPITFQSKEDGLVFSHVLATLVNSGEVAAHNIRGHVEFEPRGYVKTVKGVRDAHITDVFDNNAYFRWESLVPRPYPPIGTLRERSFLDSPRQFVIPITAMGQTRTELHFWFVCDEGASVEGIVDLGHLGDPIERSG